MPGLERRARSRWSCRRRAGRPFGRRRGCRLAEPLPLGVARTGTQGLDGAVLSRTLTRSARAQARECVVTSSLALRVSIPGPICIGGMYFLEFLLRRVIPAGHLMNALQLILVLLLVLA